ncbi:MAG TPA: kelch repeat-containing protein [Bryobacteraceae bacterium]|nr:kelch repeat-containing protein [Bryobacteraceae bacterium]
MWGHTNLALAALAIAISASGLGRAQSWEPMEHQPAFGASTALLLTDGKVMVQDTGNSDWWQLTPDAFGSYVKGNWTQLASLPSGYAPLYYASAVLADGRVVVIGGEYNFFAPVWTNLGAIYDPKVNKWTSLPAPDGWDNIGDAQDAVLADGKFLLAHPFGTEVAVLDPKTLKWSAVGTGKADSNDEEGWTLLPDGSILTVDIENVPHAERYIPKTGEWVGAGSTVDTMVTGEEIGPAVLRPDGSVFATGATGHTGIYTPPSHHGDPGAWRAGPDFPDIMGEGQLDIADGPATLLPNGNVLCAASPGIFQAPIHFFEFDGKKLNQVAAVPNSSFETSFVGRMLLLPTGQVLFTDGTQDVEIYTPGGSAKPEWRPRIDSCPKRLKAGNAYRISGEQFNGLSQAVAYGDDATAATNYPLVRITNHATGHVFYARTHDHSTMAVATGGAKVSTHFDTPKDLEPGTGDLVVIANGIASSPRRIESPLDVLIDIKPRKKGLADINLPNPGKIAVAILSSRTFDAVNEIDTASLTFGHTGDEHSLAFCGRPRDVNGDGLSDLVCHFWTSQTAFEHEGATAAFLEGRTVKGLPIEGEGQVRVVRRDGRDNDD